VSWLGISLMFLMGVSLGLLGGGGSILAVPILVYVLDVGPHFAIACSLVLVGSTALVGALIHQRNGQVAWRDGLLFAAIGAPLNLLGAALARNVRGPVLLLLFGLLMLGAGVAMLLPRREGAASGGRDWRAIVASAAGVGFLTGFLGVGGGFLIVPALVLFVGMPIKLAVGTSLFVISLNSAVGAFGHRHALTMDLRLLAVLVGVALAGALAGVVLSRRITPPQLRRVFGAFILVVGLLMAARNAAALLGWMA
jgi:uncharacterized membrane protein YfcA